MADELVNRAVMLRNACMYDNEPMFVEAAQGFDINVGLNWVGRRLGISGVHYLERTPLMLATMYGSENVMRLILQTHGVDINRRSVTDHLTAMDCYFVYKPPNKHVLDLLCALNPQYNQHLNFSENINLISCDQDPDMSGWNYETVHFMTYKFKMRPCCWGDLCLGWQWCPYLHPQDPFRRRDFTKQSYKCEPCRFDLNYSCTRGSMCGYAHGGYEIGFHPDWFRTQVCQYGMFCNRKACWNAHHCFEVRSIQRFDAFYPRVPLPPLPPGPIFLPIPYGIPQFVQPNTVQVMNNSIPNLPGSGGGQIVQYYALQVMNSSVLNPPGSVVPQFVQQQYNASLALPSGHLGHGQIGVGPSQVMNFQSQNLRHHHIPRPTESASTSTVMPSSSQQDIAETSEQDEVPPGLDLSFLKGSAS